MLRSAGFARSGQVFEWQTIGGCRAAPPAGNGLAAIGAAINNRASGLNRGQADAVGRGAGASAQGLVVTDHRDHAVGICADSTDVLAGLVFTNLGQRGRNIGLRRGGDGLIDSGFTPACGQQHFGDPGPNAVVLVSR